MNAQLQSHPEKVIRTDALCACHAVHTHNIHHRDFPEVHVEGLTPGDAAVHLADRLVSLLDSSPNAETRGRVEGAIADVREFLATAPAPADEGDVTAAAPRVVDIRPHGTHIAEARSCELLRGDRMEALRLVMHRGKELPSHRARGEATVHVVEGLVDFHVGETTHRLGVGQILHLRKQEPHALRALEDSILLVTIVRD